MNIVFLFSDEHAGAVMGNSGHPVVQTPHLDRLAEQSYTFDNAYCNYPICTPSRLSMLTGRYPHQIEAWIWERLQIGSTQRGATIWQRRIMKPCYVDGRISTGLIVCSVFLIACWTICIGGGTQPVVHHDAPRTRGAAPTHTSLNVDRGTMNTPDMTRTLQIWQWISSVKKRPRQTISRSCFIADSCTHISL